MVPMNRRLIGLLLGSCVIAVGVVVSVASGRLLTALMTLVGWIIFVLVVGSVGGWEEPRDPGAV
jgi:hypothetical protein